MNENGKVRFIQGLCPYGAGAPTPGFIAWEPIRMGGKQGKRKGRPGWKRPIRLGPASALGSRPRVALSSGRANGVYIEWRYAARETI